VSAYWLVMPAAGAGRRFGGPKQHALLGGRSVLETALQLFVADRRCNGGSIVLPAEDPRTEPLGARLPARFRLVPGGSDRAHSVYNGLVALDSRAQPRDWVLVHDAARPCLSARDLDRLLELGESERVGALLAIPVPDTVKRAQAGEQLRSGAGDAAVRCASTVAREGLWLAQTPQMFRYAPLREALKQADAAGRVPTDEAQAMEWLGLSARLVQASDSNLKVTSAADLVVAAAILRARGEPA
jgi:2-C-methyl-D-erythritol 4-phosphate cytidylyltransferase